MDTPFSSLLDRVALVKCSEVVTRDDLPDIRWYFEDPRIGGRLGQNKVTFIGDRRFIMEFEDVGSCDRTLARIKHNVKIGSSLVDMTVEHCPLDVARRHLIGASSLRAEMDDESSFMIISEDSDQSGTQRYGIIPDDRHNDCVYDPTEHTGNSDFKDSFTCEPPSEESIADIMDSKTLGTDDPGPSGAGATTRSPPDRGVRRLSSAEPDRLHVAKKIKMEESDPVLNVEPVPNNEKNVTGVSSSPMPVGASESDSPDARARTIQVLDVPANDFEILELYLESVKNGGGDVESFSHDKENHYSVVVFADEEVAKRFLNVGSIYVNDNTLLITPLPEVEEKQEPMKEEEEEEKAQCIAPVAVTTIQVKGVTPKITSGVLTLYFENRKRSDGGPIQELKVFPEEQRAVITFQDEEVAKRVLARGQHTLLSARLECEAVDSGSETSSELYSVEVSGFTEKISEEMLLYFFENRKRSGGGPVEEMFYDARECRATVTFKNAEVVERVLQNHRSVPLVLNDVRLSISALRPAPSSPRLIGDVEPDKLLLTNIPEDSLPDDLLRFIQRGSGSAVTKMRYSMRPGVAMAQFQDMFDYHRLKGLIRSRPFQGVMLSIQRVPVPCSIQIFDSGKLTIDHLMLYFENPKSGGDEVVSCKPSPEGDYVVLTFADKNVVPRVLSREHNMEGQRLSVSAFYEGLGAMPPDVDDGKPAWWFPSDFTFSCDSKKLSFVQSCPKVRSQIENALEAEHCKIEWPVLTKKDSQCGVMLHCTLTRRTKNVGQLAKTWASSCRDRVTRELEGILVKDINVLQELWKTVIDRATLIDEKINLDESQLSWDHDTCTIRIVGVEKSSEKFVRCVQEVVKKSEEELQREKCKISEQIPKLKLHQFELLKLDGLLESSSTSGDGEVEVVTKGTEVELIGQPGDIIAKKLLMFERLNAITSESVELPAFVIESLKLPQFRTHVSQCLRDRGVVSTWIVGPKGLTVYALNPDEINRTSGVMKSEVMQRALDLDPAQAATLMLPTWAALRTLLVSTFGVFTLKEETSRLTVTAINDNMNGLIEEIHNFIKENAIKEEFLMTKRGTAVVVSQYLKKELQDACNDLRSCHMSIREELGPDRTGFVISITEHGVQAALSKVVEISNKVLEKEKVLDRPGMSNYLHSMRGKKQIEVIQSSHEVFIEEWEEANRSSLVSFAARKRRLNASAADVSPQVLAETKLQGSFVVKIVLGDITNYKVDAIVNAANGQLDHIGGVARHIVDKGGPEIQSECRAYIRKNGSMIAGNFYVSQPGKLPCKHIIHAVGPMWQKGAKNEDNVLYETVYNVLAESERMSLASVAMPAISTGVFGFPLRKAAKIILEAVEEFVERDSPYSLREVHIIDNNRSVTDEFKDMFQVKFKGQREPIVIDDDNDTFDQMSRSLRPRKSSSDVLSSRLMTRSLSTTYSFPSTSASSSSSSASLIQSSPASSAVSGSVLTTSQGMRISLVKGSIVQQQVDVIVNTTSQTLVLSNGAVSSLILQTAGPQIQVECQQNAPSGATQGQVVVTCGYNLPCSEVYHGFCLNWDNAAGPCEKSVRDLLKAVFRQVNISGWQSVAIPAIGTGNLKIPAAVVAKIMYEEAEEFSRSTPTTSLTDVRFVVYDKDLPTIAAFEQELHFPTRGQKSKGKKPEDRVLSKGKNSTESKPSESVGGWSINIDEVKLEVTHGDITEATTDAIVNSTNEALNLKLGAVSAAILKAGGPRVLEECMRIGKMTDGMAVTRAGDLATKYIFHLKAHSTERGWKKGIENCLAEAERRQLRSLTFPLLGTGNIRAPVQMMASVMLDAVMNFCTKSNPQHLSLIRISIFQPQMVEEFAKAIDEKAREHQTSGLFNRFKVLMKSVFGFSDNSPPKTFDVQEISSRVRKFDERVRFTIYGLTDNAIDSAIVEMEELCSDIIQDKVIEKDSIAKLSDEQIKRIYDLETECSAKITVEKGQRLNRIRIQGEGQAIVSVLDKIYAIFAEVEEQQREEYHAEIIAHQAQWMYQCDDSYDLYPKPINLVIEKAYQNQAPFAKWEEDDGAYHLDFQRMEETKDGKSVVKVKRMTSESPIPKSWDTMNADELCKRVVLSASSQEYQDVLKQIRLSDGGTVRQVISIERIQNPSLYQQYVVRREAMQRVQQGTSTCERILWHGTSADTLESINFHGFNRSYCGKNAVVYGKGVYFAQGFQYSGSNTYAVPDISGHKHVYQSRVLTGEFVVGNQTCIVPPAKPGRSAVQYDSVVDNPAAPSIFVIFSDTQAYPEYLIIFK